MSNLKPKKRGDSWNGLQITIEDTDYDFEGCSARIHFRKESKTGPLVFKYETEDGTLVRTDNVFKMTERRMDYPAATYYFDLEVTFANGRRETFYEDKIQLNQDVSY